MILCKAQEVSIRWQVNRGGGRQGTAPLGSPERAVRRGADADADADAEVTDLLGDPRGECRVSG